MIAIANEHFRRVPASSHAITQQAEVTAKIADAVKGPRAPSPDFYVGLMHQDIIAITVAVLIPNGLATIVPHTTERLLCFRLAGLFGARTAERESVPVCVQSLRAQNTTESRKALACVPKGLPWSRASREERRLILASTFLRVRAWGAAP